MDYVGKVEKERNNAECNGLWVQRNRAWMKGIFVPSLRMLFASRTVRGTNQHVARNTQRNLRLARDCRSWSLATGRSSAGKTSREHSAQNKQRTRKISMTQPLTTDPSAWRPKTLKLTNCRVGRNVKACSLLFPPPHVLLKTAACLACASDWGKVVHTNTSAGGE